jgi:hypothetical protein
MNTLLILLALINPVQQLKQDLSKHLEIYTHKGGSELNRSQFQRYVLRPSLEKIGLYSPQAERLLTMIVAHESLKGHYIVQTTGQAKGLYQMENATHDDVLRWVHKNRPELYRQIVEMGDGQPSAVKLITDLDYATAMARAFFLRFPEALPTGNDEELAAYAKKRWNTSLGKATPDDYLKAYQSWK